MSIYIEIRDPKKDLKKKIRTHKRQRTLHNLLWVGGILMAILSTFLLVEMQTYTHQKVVRSYKGDISAGEYVEFGKGFLKYTRDGIECIDSKGKAQWNQSYQIKNPMVIVNGDSGAVAEKGGNDIIVFNKKGPQGNIHTNYPIEKMVISPEGIVGALLKNETKPQIICFDPEGEILIEHQSTINGKGYPIGMALSPNGTILQVSYLCVEDGVQATRVSYYNFGKNSSAEDDFLVTEEIYKNTVIPETIFLNNRKSILISDNSIIFYKGDERPEKDKEIKLDKDIISFFHDDDYLGFLLANKNQEGCELRLYDMSGSIKLSKTIEEKVGKVKISDGSVIIYNGNQCDIYTTMGIHKFDGQMKEDILQIKRLPGINRYLVISEGGIAQIRLVK